MSLHGWALSSAGYKQHNMARRISDGVALRQLSRLRYKKYLKSSTNWRRGHRAKEKHSKDIAITETFSLSIEKICSLSTFAIDTDPERKSSVKNVTLNPNVVNCNV